MWARAGGLGGRPFSSANNDGSGVVSNTVFKSSGPSRVGVLLRESNKRVTVFLPSTQPFTMTVKYNGRSTGTTYVFLAVPQT